MKNMNNNSSEENNNRINDENVVVKSDSDKLHRNNSSGIASEYDDIDDYIYMKPKKSKRKSSHSNSDGFSGEYVDTPVVFSNKGSGKKRRVHHKKSKKKMKRWKKVLLSVICTLLGLIVVFVGTVALMYYNGGNELTKTDYVISAPQNVEVQNNGQFVVYNGVTYKYNDNMTSILLMGIDQRELEGEKTIGQAGQADVNILLAIDTDTGKMTMINISRDIMTEVTEYSAGGAYVGMETMQLCLAYSFGDGKETSCNNQVSTVKRIFYNIPINSYFSLDLDGIAAINDSVGGVDVVSP